MKKGLIALAFLSSFFLSGSVFAAVAAPAGQVVIPLQAQIDEMDGMTIKELKDKLIRIGKNVENAQKNVNPQNAFLVEGLNLAEWRQLGDEGRTKLETKKALDEAERAWFVFRAWNCVKDPLYYCVFAYLMYHAFPGVKVDALSLWDGLKYFAP